MIILESSMAGIENLHELILNGVWGFDGEDAMLLTAILQARSSGIKLSGR